MVLVCIYLFGFKLDSQSLIHLYFELELLELSFLKVGKKQKQSRQQNSWYYSCGPRDMNLSHIRRFQEHFNHINVLIGSSTLQFLQFWNQNVVNILFLVIKSLKVTSGFNSKLMKKNLDGSTNEIFDI